MKKEEIIKTLECCFVNKNCRGCPQYEEELCISKTSKEALSLIREQEKRIEELTLEKAGVKAETVRKMVERLKEKIIDVDTDVFFATLWMECVTVEDIEQIAKEMSEET